MTKDTQIKRLQFDNRPPLLNPPNPIEHIPVLYDEVLASLNIQPDGIYLDGTLGMAGHAYGILQASAPTGYLLALDQDPTAITIAQRRLVKFTKRLTIVHSNFSNMKSVAEAEGITAVDGILLDLGFSSLQLADEQRGFSFHSDGPLDMRLDPTTEVTAAHLINSIDEKTLADLIYRYGEEKWSRRIARAIVRHRPFVSAKELGRLIARTTPKTNTSRIHPATRTFQALRIAVNDELGILERVLPEAVSLLKPNGRLAIISFHSLEDRIVKRFFRQEMSNCLCPSQLLFCACHHQATLDRNHTTRKPITPKAQEIAQNPRARSAKLRVATRLAL